MSATTQPVEPTTSLSSKRKWLWVIIGSVLFVLLMSAIGYFVGNALRPYQIKGTELNPPIPSTDFTMTSARTEQPVSLSDFGGKFVFLYFGYATCPDVCPATLSKYTKAYNMLTPQEQEAVQLVWITVDPVRDTPEVMEEYVAHFAPDFMLGVIPTSDEQLADVAQAYFAHYEKIDYGSEAGYLMDHSAGVALIDPDGMWRVQYSFNTPPEDVAADLKYLVEHQMN